MKKFFPILLLCFVLSPASGRAQRSVLAFPPLIEKDLSAGASAIYLLDFPSARVHFDRAIRLEPDHPAAYFFQLMLTWYRLTYDSLMQRNPPLEQLLERQADLAIEKAKIFSKKTDEAVGYLYWGGALGAKGWYHVTRNQWVRAYFSGKKGYNYVKKTADADPELYDAYLGIGVYEYYAATLGPTLKALASFSIRGDKGRALEYLRTAENKSRFVKLEAAYFQWNAALEEGRLAEAQQKADVLVQTMPHSPLFHWCRIQTLFAEKKWEDVLKKGEEFAALAEAAPQLENYRNPFDLLLSKVYYHCGMSAYNLGRRRLAKIYFDRTIDTPSEFQGWKVMAYLRRGELFDLEGKRTDALIRYRAVLQYPDVWDSHKTAKKRMKEAFKLVER